MEKVDRERHQAQGVEEIDFAWLASWIRALPPEREPSARFRLWLRTELLAADFRLDPWPRLAA